MYRRHGSTEYDPEHYLEIPNGADAYQSYKAEYDSESVSGIQSDETTMPNEMPTQSRLPRDTQLETAIDFRINTESSLTNRYCIRQSRMTLVVGGATTFKREGMTVPELRTTPTANTHHTGSAGTKAPRSAFTNRDG